MRIFALILLLFAFVGCQSNGGDTDSAPANAPASEAANSATTGAGSFSGEVTETMNAGGYTYVQVDNGTEKIWAAGPQQSMAVGTRVEVSKAMPMQGFRSEALERTFDVLYFVGGFEPEGDHEHPAGGGDPHGGSVMGGQTGGQVGGQASDSGATVELGKIAPAGQTVAVIHSDRASLAGQTVRVRGKVVKSLSGIMGANWMHIQDGTGEAGSNDLTVTAAEIVPVGTMVVVEGVLLVDRDFGSGYKYDVIIEDAKVTVE